MTDRCVTDAMSVVVLCDHQWWADGTDHECGLDEGHPEQHVCGACGDTA